VNRQIATSDLLQTGNGLLAQGPVPLLVVYKEALKSHGIVVEILSPFPPAGRVSSLVLQNKLRKESKVLLFDDFFISGTGWTAFEKLHLVDSSPRLTRILVATGGWFCCSNGNFPMRSNLA
jgi:hypothetical protein